MPKKQRLTDEEDAQQSQYLAAAMQITQQLLKNKQMPRDFVVNYISAMLFSWLTGQCVGLFANNSLARLGSFLDVSQYEKLPTEKIKLMLKVVEPQIRAIYKSSPMVRQLFFKEQLLSSSSTSKKGAQLVLSYYHPNTISNHPFALAFPNGCSIKSDQLQACLAQFPHTHVQHLGEGVIKLFSDSEVVSTLLKIKDLLSNKTLSASQNKQLLNCFRFLNKQVSYIQFLDALNMGSNIINLITVLISTVIQSACYVLQGNLSQRLFGQAQLNLIIKKQRYTITSPADIEKLDLPAKELYNILQKLQRNAIPWEKYLNQALAMVLPLLMVIVLQLDTSQIDTLAWMTSFIFPIFFSLLNRTIEFLYEQAIVRSRIAVYAPRVEICLNIMLASASDFIDVEKVQLVDDLHQIQFAIRPSITLRSDPMLTAKIVAITDLFDKYNLDYIEVGNRKQIAAIYVNAMDVWQLFGGYVSTTGRSANRFSQQLKNHLAKIVYAEHIEKELLLPLRELRWITYYRTKHDNTHLIYSINFGENFTVFFNILKTLHMPIKGQRILLTIAPDAASFELIQKKFQELITIINTSTDNSHPDGATNNIGASTPSNIKNEIPQAATVRKRKSKRLKIPEATVAAEEVLTWNYKQKLIHSTDDNVYIIAGTERYQNPIYITHNLEPEQFNTLNIYQRVLEQIQYPRYAARKNQPGLFVQKNQQLLTVKVLGRNGQGDVRCEARGFIEANNKSGCHLYVVDIVSSH